MKESQSGKSQSRASLLAASVFDMHHDGLYLKYKPQCTAEPGSAVTPGFLHYLSQVTPEDARIRAHVT